MGAARTEPSLPVMIVHGFLTCFIPRCPMKVIRCDLWRFAMKSILTLALSCLASSSLLAADKPPPRQPIKPPFECIQIHQVNAWHVVNDHTLTVGNGPKHFRVDLRSKCPQLTYGAPGLRFRASHSNRALGNAIICGEMGESVSGHDRPSCPIQSVNRIDEQEYRRLNQESRRGGSGANEPTKP